MSQPNKQVVSPTILIQQIRNTDQQQSDQDSNKEHVEDNKHDLEHQKQKTQQKQQQQPKYTHKNVNDGVTIFCRICDDFIAHSVTTVCEHTFCELCLIQYMIYIDECPECGARIRNQRLSNNILLDNLIMEYVQKYQPQEVEVFQERLQTLKTYQRDKKLNDFQSGMKIDVRDSDYVWCTGRIYRTVNKFQDKKVKWMTVKYDKTNKKEEFPQNSPRIAPFGFYTNRKDIPRYQRGKLVLENQEENIIYNLPNRQQEQQEKEISQNQS